MFRVLRPAPFAILIASLIAASARATPPRYDHVVIVVEENHSYGDIIGNSANAPFMNALATQGVSFSKFFAVAHPSQANYLHLFCGSALGVTTDAKPVLTPFSVPNLGSELMAAGFTFKGYSEDLPAAGDATTLATYNSTQHTLYARKHNPWANWQDATLPTPANRLRPSVNQPFTSFPTDFTMLPTVAFVIPNAQHDMHSGTIAMADHWLSANLGAYAMWAETHNSLLVITWDEDDLAAANRIPTIFAGAGLIAGANAVTWTHHNLLRMLEDMYGTGHAGGAKQVAPISGVFAGDPASTKLVFQQGVNNYAGTLDTQIRKAAPKIAYGAKGALSVDLDESVAFGNQPVQSLVRFDGIIGAGVDQVPPGATIVSAKLVLATGSSRGDGTGSSLKLHRLLVGWSAASTWKSLDGGVSANDIEASAAADFTLIPAGANSRVIFDATAAVQAWTNGSANYGWALLPTSADNWRWLSSEFGTASVRPMLEVMFHP
jgi:hypothetical protein